MPEIRSAPPTADQLRHAIDSGRTGEKVSFPDPAAAPLGTDAEAGGHAPGRGELALDAASSADAYRRPRVPGIAIYSGLVAIVSAAILAAVAVGG